MDTHEQYMQIAYKEAKKSLKYGEIPVGAIIVYNDEVVAKAYNKKEKSNIATAHAEIIAIEKACKKLGTWHLDDCTMYVTLEPCIMCTGAIIQSHLGRVVIGANANKQKGMLSLFDTFSKPSLNHYPTIISGILELECSQLIRDFFKKIRTERRG